MARLLWVVQKPVYFLGRQWNGVDIASVFTLTAIHLLALLAPFSFTWSAFWLAVVLYYVTGVGVTLSFHRNLAHKSFKLPKWLEYFFTYCAVHSLQLAQESPPVYGHPRATLIPLLRVSGLVTLVGSLIFVNDLEVMMDGYTINVGDLKKQSYHKFLHYTYPYHCIACGVVLYRIGGMPYLVWALVIEFLLPFLISKCIVLSIYARLVGSKVPIVMLKRRIWSLFEPKSIFGKIL
ncbi:putative acyl-CoA desaturase [Rosa chinensis]|uniref:Putative acyl-CoA desaturase n=1 Tax=Rosa chinensis TaxID=74649 RepID=A0A2P6PGH8_ROSCH|nr:putative acyl-CoA desaturase [Rosa chinensis]